MCTAVPNFLGNLLLMGPPIIFLIIIGIIFLALDPKKIKKFKAILFITLFLFAANLILITTINDGTNKSKKLTFKNCGQDLLIPEVEDELIY